MPNQRLKNKLQKNISKGLLNRSIVKNVRIPNLRAQGDDFKADVLKREWKVLTEKPIDELVVLPTELTQEQVEKTIDDQLEFKLRTDTDLIGKTKDEQNRLIRDYLDSPLNIKTMMLQSYDPNLTQLQKILTAQKAILQTQIPEQLELSTVPESATITEVDPTPESGPPLSIEPPKLETLEEFMAKPRIDTDELTSDMQNWIDEEIYNNRSPPVYTLKSDFLGEFRDVTHDFANTFAAPFIKERRNNYLAMIAARPIMSYLRDDLRVLQRPRSFIDSLKFDEHKDTIFGEIESRKATPLTNAEKHTVRTVHWENAITKLSDEMPSTSQAGSGFKTKSNYYISCDEMKTRLNILLGEVNAGNNNKKIKSEILQLVRALNKMNKLSNKRAKSITKQFI